MVVVVVLLGCIAYRQCSVLIASWLVCLLVTTSCAKDCFTLTNRDAIWGLGLGALREPFGGGPDPLRGRGNFWGISRLIVKYREYLVQAKLVQ